MEDITYDRWGTNLALFLVRMVGTAQRNLFGRYIVPGYQQAFYSVDQKFMGAMIKIRAYLQ